MIPLENNRTEASFIGLDGSDHFVTIARGGRWLELRSATTGKVEATLGGFGSPIGGALVLHDGELVAFARRSAQLRAWRLDEMRNLPKLAQAIDLGHAKGRLVAESLGEIGRVKELPDRRLLVQTRRGPCHIVDVARGELLRTFAADAVSASH